MPRAITFCAVTLFVVAAAWAQSPGPEAGVESEWDLRKLLDSLSTAAHKLQPIIQQADPQTWANTQAASTYTPQWRTASDQIQYLTQTTTKFAKEPERMTIALETYFRLQALESTIKSLAEGVRKYKSPSVADALLSALTDNLNNREHLKNYVTELAHTREEEFKIIDKEAQRCRGILSRQPPAPAQEQKRSRSKPQ